MQRTFREPTRESGNPIPGILWDTQRPFREPFLYIFSRREPSENLFFTFLVAENLQRTLREPSENLREPSENIENLQRTLENFREPSENFQRTFRELYGPISYIKAELTALNSPHRLTKHRTVLSVERFRPAMRI